MHVFVHAWNIFRVDGSTTTTQEVPGLMAHYVDTPNLKLSWAVSIILIPVIIDYEVFRKYRVIDR